MCRPFIGIINIAKICKNCEYWSQDKYSGSKDGYRECSELIKEVLMSASSYEEISYYQTRPEFGCILWRRNIKTCTG